MNRNPEKKEARSQKPEARMGNRLFPILASGFWLLASSFRIHHRLVPFLQLLAIPLHIFPALTTELEILCELEAGRRAGILASTAEHASGNIERIVGEDLLTRRVPLPSNLNAVLRTGQRAEVAGNAQGLAGFRIVIQSRRTAVSLGDFRPNFRILFCIVFRRTLI